ncbi:chorismate synthase [bacterium]|nr:chorismate synthase [bacterium]
MNNFRFLTAGESHGKCLTAIIEGVPAGITIDVDFINNELKRRQQGYGRGERMQIENDTVEITSGVRFGKTLGSPITLVIQNRDFESWKKIMSVAPEDITDEKAFSTYRPGHADYAGSVKYNQTDLRNVLERSSARKTAIEVAVGAIAKLVLKELDITGSSKVLQIGSACCAADFESEVDIMRGKGDTVGGKFVVIYKNLPVGLGSHVHWDRGIDGKLAQAIMSIPAVKVVEIGTNPLGYQGSAYHDEIFINNGEIERKTNNAGGIEGGMTNGEDLVVFGVMKPIPTMKTPLKTVDSQTKEETEAHFERSDVCAVEACSVVAEARVAWILVDEILHKFGGDSLEELRKNYNK